jgi:hypothetical protein
MTDEAKAPEPNEESAQARSDWASDAEAALEGVGNALRQAWDASRDARLNALESAKQAAQQLGEAIDQGVTAARERWEAQAAAPSDLDSPEAGEEEAGEEAVAPPRPAPQMSADEGRSEEG